MKPLGILTVVSASLLLTACGDAFSPENVSGSYQLVSVDGNPLPFLQTLTEDGLTTLTINSASVTLHENGTFSTSMSVEFSIDGSTESATWTSSGTFTLTQPARINFSDDIDDEQMSATLDGDMLTVIDDGTTYLYER